MAEAFVQVLLDNLTSILKEELGLLFGFENEFERLSSMFSTIQAVLEDAQERQLKDKPIENWLQKLNIATYEVDDILDEYKTKATRFLHSKYGRYHPKAISFRHKVGKRMEKVMKTLNAIAEERRNFHLREKNIERQIATRETGPILPEGQVYGRGKEEDEIVKILINNVQELVVLPIVGMGGLGKTTLAQMVYKNQRVTEYFNPRIWVCVSDDFDEKRLIKTIIGNIAKTSLEVDDLATLQKELQELLNGKRYLLVLDDVWNEDQQKWDNLRAVLKVGESGASVLTTTRLPNVGSIMGTLQSYGLSNLSQEDCWLLFMQRAFEPEEAINPNLVAIGKEIVKKGGGVPLAAKTLGGILRFKREVKEWEHVRDSEIWNLTQDESSILPALRLSYHHLPLDLRQCFVYCAVFPKDTKMEKKSLISRWMAHGFLLSRGNLEPEDVGNRVWKELCLRSFFQEIEVKGCYTYFKMHDLIHDLATSLFSASTSSSHIREIDVKDYSYRKLLIGFSKLEPSYSLSLLKKFVSLRVLTLRASRLKQLPSSIGDLVHLRYLDLSDSSIRSLPKKLYRLQNLQTLDLHNCSSLSSLPKQTSKLVNLQNLLLDGCNRLPSTPPRIGSLTCLKTLGWFVVGERKGHQLGELRNLNLYGSIEITHLERVKNDKDAREANLCAKGNLHSLSLIWGEDTPRRYELEEVKVLEALKPHPNLTSLEIKGFRGFRLPPFGELPCLESLWLWNGSVELEYVKEDVDVHSGRFPSLRKLTIAYFCNLKGLMKKEGEGQFPVLEEMYIHWCPEFVFPTLSSIKELYVSGEIADVTGLRSISNLRSLTSLSISYNCTATFLPEEMFKSLANLKYLEMYQFSKLKELPASLVSLNALKSLKIKSCYELENLPEEGVKGLTSLTQLSISHCEMLKCLPEGLQQLIALTSLTIWGCSTLAQRCEEGTGQDWHKIAHIPNINIES